MTPYGQWHTRELELFVELLGMNDHDALLCMTRNAARATPRHGADVGTLAPGKFADLLVVDGRPDHDVRVLADRSRLRGASRAGVDVALARRPDRPRPAPVVRAHPHLHERAVRAAGADTTSDMTSDVTSTDAARRRCCRSTAARRSSPARPRASVRRSPTRLAEAGARVVVADRDVERCQGAAPLDSTAAAVRSRAAEVDVADEALGRGAVRRAPATSTSSSTTPASSPTRWPPT